MDEKSWMSTGVSCAPSGFRPTVKGVFGVLPVIRRNFWRLSGTGVKCTDLRLLMAKGRSVSSHTGSGILTGELSPFVASLSAVT